MGRTGQPGRTGRPGTGSGIFQPVENFFPIIGKNAKNFSNHWKTGEESFQSLEKTGLFFQPLEKKFPIIGKFFLGAAA